MRWYYAAGVILALLLGLGLGRLIAPRYHEPADSSEARLKARAVEYYQAGRLFETMKMRRYLTPVRQTVETDKLKAEAARLRQYWDDMDEPARKDQYASASMISADCVDTEMYTGEGWGWAVTSGQAMLQVEGHSIEQQLERLVWVLSDGDWWIYSRTVEELNTYGNPPDPILNELRSQIQRTKPGEIKMSGMSTTGTADGDVPAGADPATAPPNEAAAEVTPSD